ncbi:hypothetical protein ACFLW0_02455 [Chloroflexota bacterium]
MPRKKKNKEESQYLSVVEFASEVGYSCRQIYRYIDTGTVIASRAPERRKWQIHRSEVNRFRGENTVSPQEVEIPTQVQKEVNPVIIKSKDEHFQHLLGVVKILLQNEVGKAFGIPSEGDTPETDNYSIIGGKSDYEKIPRGYLVERIEHNQDYAIKTYNMYDFWECFVPHFMADVNRDIGFREFYENHTIEFIETLLMLIQRETFNGTCPVCEDW